MKTAPRAPNLSTAIRALSRPKRKKRTDDETQTVTDRIISNSSKNRVMHEKPFNQYISK